MQSVGWMMVAALGAASAPAWADPAETPEPASRAVHRHLGLPLAGAVTNPEWAAKPNGDDLAREYPRIAAMLQLPGQASIKCKVTVLGQLEGCTVISETPAGLGFGSAAIRMSASFRMRPQTLDGAPVAGGGVVIPLNFKLPETPPPNDANPPVSSPEGLALGRRLVAASGLAQQLSDWSEGYLRELLRQSGIQEPDSPETRIAIDVMREAFAAMSSTLLERRAAHYAADIPPAKLEIIAAFADSDAGQLWVREQRLNLADVGRDVQQIWPAAIDDVRRRFCAKVACAAGVVTPVANK